MLVNPKHLFFFLKHTAPPEIYPLSLPAPLPISGVIGIAAGTWHSLALLADGTVVAWGDDSLGQTDLPPGLADAVAVAAGGNHNLALQADGRSEEHTSELQSQSNLVCRLLLEKKN